MTLTKKCSVLIVLRDGFGKMPQRRFWMWKKHNLLDAILSVLVYFIKIKQKEKYVD
ncbi:hypothetical protein Cst_c14010 [Thermoclostridium stercorarium subsp. stercorarium DSM 8532]|uniref:Uncharacterized protein n=1 Tax=Thermoclostridium stercorarium (strain ATCC 35414 / DSM 8532 / NCIMB 11754) TaxID=1121335 RepID=L7VNN6_THES1|nr:hypothetical protein Cst_c14010 [Thermoclostridium stercorarium subsp. stercorarium DSM 8532]